MVMSVIIPIAALIVGNLNFPAQYVAGMMILIEIVFSLFLFVEVKKDRLPRQPGWIILSCLIFPAVARAGRSPSILFPTERKIVQV